MRKSSKISGIIIIILITLSLFFFLLAETSEKEYELDILNKNFELQKGYSQSHEFNLFNKSEIKIKMKSTEPINFYIMSEENHIRRIGPNWKSFISEYEILNTKQIDETIHLGLYGKYYLTFSNWEGSRDTYIESKITSIHYEKNGAFEGLFILMLLPLLPIGIFFIGSLVPESWDEKAIKNDIVMSAGVTIEAIAFIIFFIFYFIGDISLAISLSFLPSLFGILIFSIDATNYPHRSKIYIINTVLWTFFWAMLSFIMFNDSIVSLFVILIGVVISIFLSEKTKAKEKEQNIFNNTPIIINPERKDSSLELLKNYEKLSDKEIITFLFLKNNPNTDKAKITEMFGEDVVNSLIQKKLFFEEER